MARDGSQRELGLEAAAPGPCRPTCLYLILNLMGSRGRIYGIYILKGCPWLLDIKAKWKYQDQGGATAVVWGRGLLGREKCLGLRLHFEDRDAQICCGFACGCEKMRGITDYSLDFGQRAG